MRVLIVIVLSVTIFPVANVYSQITVNDTDYSMEQIVQKLAGKGVTISNITSDCPAKKSLKPYGQFEDPVSVIGMDKGLLLTSGAARYAVGPNDSSCKTQENGYEDLHDDDLYKLLTTEKRLSDICKVEFDIIVYGDSLEFKYVFGSDEYLEFPAYHDVFGFFISGPGISGTQNLAVIEDPKTKVISPVNVNTINTVSNPEYYINNGTGSTPFYNFDLQYDGYTTVLKAKAKIVPCEKYHLKLAIADVKDATCDAGVFIEEGSFTTPEPVISKVVYQYPKYTTAMEVCNKAYIVFKRGNNDKSQSKTVNYFIKGTATNGTDYTMIANSLVIPAGKDTAFITIDALADNIEDAGEFVRIVLPNLCPGEPDIDSVDVVINELFPYTISPEKICIGEEATLNKNPDDNLSFIWKDNSTLSCLNCASPVANPLSDTKYFYEVTDKTTGCKAKDSVLVSIIQPPVADFSFETRDDYMPNDIFFTNLSVNSDAWEWNFGDGKFSSEKNPMNNYPINKNFDPVYYNVTLISKLQGHTCRDTITKTVEITTFFIPNLITKNEDGKNDEFRIIGIKPGVWNVSIFNRWGQEVYKSKEYENNWKGEKESDGVYYFYLSNPPKNREFKGWLHIIR